MLIISSPSEKIPDRHDWRRSSSGRTWEGGVGQMLTFPPSPTYIFFCPGYFNELWRREPFSCCWLAEGKEGKNVPVFVCGRQRELWQRKLWDVSTLSATSSFWGWYLIWEMTRKKYYVSHRHVVCRHRQIRTWCKDSEHLGLSPCDFGQVLLMFMRLTFSAVKCE